MMKDYGDQFDFLREEMPPGMPGMSMSVGGSKDAV
jgi:uncharacterized protein (UPF0276 family)